MIEFIDRGTASYRTVWDEQHNIFNRIIAEKRKGEKISREYVIMVEHDPVFTFGRHADHNNLLVSQSMLSAINAECVEIERGGDVTFHGPGQLVVYPILDLTNHRLGVKSYVGLLEQSVIDTLSEYGIKGERIEGATGVWIGKDSPDESKICAIGIKVSHGITMHGLALNVSTDLSYFNLINPCGFTDKGVTSISQLLGKQIDIMEVKQIFKEKFLGLI